MVFGRRPCLVILVDVDAVGLAILTLHEAKVKAYNLILLPQNLVDVEVQRVGGKL